jgi:DNA-directed RNA polymerase subunit RPC12/RpoP
MSKIKKKPRCPYCNSKNIRKVKEKDFNKCLNCQKEWRINSEWLHKGMKVWLDNLDGIYSKLSNKKKEKYQTLIRSFGKKYSSSEKIFEEDPQSALNILLIAMEEIMEAFAILLHKNLPSTFLKSHEVKMTPYFNKLPDGMKVNEDNNDKIYLFIDISGEPIRPLYLNEEEFWKVEADKDWKSLSERYGVMFRDGRYYRSEKWKDFCKKECPDLAYVLRYCVYYLDYIEEKDKIKGTFMISGEGNIFLICYYKELEDYWKQKVEKKETKNSV